MTTMINWQRYNSQEVSAILVLAKNGSDGTRNGSIIDVFILEILSNNTRMTNNDEWI